MNKPFAVVVALGSGRPNRVRVWLDDGMTETWLTAPDGIAFATATLFPIAKAAGTFRLWAWATDACGRSNQTGLTRRVSVQ